MIDALAEAGLETELVDCAGTGRLEFNAGDPAVTEITMGAAFLGLADASEASPGSRSLAAGHASELCERFDRLVLLQDGAVLGEADTYRALGDQFTGRSD